MISTYLNFFLQISKEQSYVKEIIICRSELSQKKKEAYLNWIIGLKKSSKLNCDLILSSAAEPKKAGANRNRGARLARAEWVSLIDADDVYSDTRLSFISRTISSNKNVNLILHSYTYDHEIDITPLAIEEAGYPGRVVQSQEIFNSTFDSLGNAVTTNVKVPDLNGVTQRVHHGHATVRREVFNYISFAEEGSGEDGIFCQEVLRNMGGVVYLPIALSIYSVHNSATNISLTKIRLLQIWNSIFFR